MTPRAAARWARTPWRLQFRPRETDPRGRQYPLRYVVAKGAIERWLGLRVTGVIAGFRARDRGGKPALGVRAAWRDYTRSDPRSPGPKTPHLGPRYPTRSTDVTSAGADAF